MWKYDQATGEMGGLTESWLPQYRLDLVIQDDTGVIRKYRGNRLGLTLKYIMLSRLRNDESVKDRKYWHRHNSHSNSYMLKINNELNYEEQSTLNSHEFNRAELEELLSSI